MIVLTNPGECSDSFRTTPDDDEYGASKTQTTAQKASEPDFGSVSIFTGDSVRAYEGIDIRNVLCRAPGQVWTWAVNRGGWQLTMTPRSKFTYTSVICEVAKWVQRVGVRIVQTFRGPSSERKGEVENRAPKAAAPRLHNVASGRNYLVFIFLFLQLPVTHPAPSSYYGPDLFRWYYLHNP
ncbi:hypothetical protein CPB86DRAFT_796923 [Serendipita vermifera]|nr:hypothetical protein CPB86DRAFT_796923 [Serendipita vermifera]